MKKSDFKIDFKKRDTISLVCFTIVMILVLVLGNAFGYVSAETGSSSTGWLNKEDYESSAYYDVDNLYVNYVSTSVGVNAENLRISYNYISDFDFSSISNVPSGFNASEMTHYFITGSSYPSGFTVYMWRGNEYTHCYYDGSSSSVVIVTGQPFNGDDKVYSCTFTPYGDGSNLMSVVAPDTITYYTCNFMSEVQRNFLRISLPGTSPCCIMTNSDLLTVEGSSVQSAVGYDFVNWFNGGTENHIVNVNYLYGSAMGLNGLDNLVGIGDGSYELAQDDSNNMYLENCKFSFNFNPYVNSITGDNMKYVGNYNKGNVTFSALLNNYQEDNIDNFSLKFRFQVLIKGTGYLPLNNPNLDGLDDGHEFYGNFYYVDTSLDFQDLLDGKTYWNASDLYPLMTDNTSMVNGNTVQHLDNFLAQVSEYSKVDWSYFKIYATCWIVSTDEGESTTSRQDSYNFLTGVAVNTEDSLGTNYNPFIDPETGEIVGDDSHSVDTDSSSQTTSTGYGNVTQNNNQTVNINNNVSNDVQNEIANIIGSTEDSDSSSWVNTLMTILSANAFLTFMSETFSFIPAVFWTSIATFFITCLSFLTGFCLLRLLFDLI